MLCLSSVPYTMCPVMRENHTPEHNFDAKQAPFYRFHVKK
jgi:hypothetical protein